MRELGVGCRAGAGLRADLQRASGRERQDVRRAAEGELVSERDAEAERVSDGGGGEAVEAAVQRGDAASDDGLGGRGERRGSAGRQRSSGVDVSRHASEGHRARLAFCRSGREA